MAFRIMEIMNYANGMKDYLNALLDYPEVDFRYIIMPSSPIPSAGGIGFNHEDILEGIALGEKDATNVINAKNSALTAKKHAEEFLKKHKLHL